MTKRFVVVYEASADLTTATDLADRVLLDKIDWLDSESLTYHRRWCGEEPSGGQLTWRSIPDRARKEGIRVHGRFDGEPEFPDAYAARRAIAYVLRRFHDVDAILLIRDVDDQQERRLGLEQARRVFESERTIVLGVAIRERECWIVSGFQPQDAEESARLDEERRRLGFDPRLDSHRLTAGKNDQAQKSPKRVLAALTNGDAGREAACWRATPLPLLVERGQENGLAEFLEEVSERLVRLIAS